MYEIEFMPEAIRQLSRLPEKIVVAALETIYVSIAENPRRVGKPLHEPLAGLRSARRGSYRIIYAISEEANEQEGTSGSIQIHRVAHRKDAYRA